MNPPACALGVKAGALLRHDNPKTKNLPLLSGRFQGGLLCGFYPDYFKFFSLILNLPRKTTNTTNIETILQITKLVIFIKLNY